MSPQLKVLFSANVVAASHNPASPPNSWASRRANASVSVDFAAGEHCRVDMVVRGERTAFTRITASSSTVESSTTSLARRDCSLPRSPRGPRRGSAADDANRAAAAASATPREHRRARSPHSEPAIQPGPTSATPARTTTASAITARTTHQRSTPHPPGPYCNLWGQEDSIGARRLLSKSVERLAFLLRM